MDYIVIIGYLAALYVCYAIGNFGKYLTTSEQELSDSYDKQDKCALILIGCTVIVAAIALAAIVTEVTIKYFIGT